jgi:hypothetical protein
MNGRTAIQYDPFLIGNVFPASVPSALASKTVASYGKIINVLGKNAGIMPIVPLALRKVDEWECSIRISPHVDA